MKNSYDGFRKLFLNTIEAIEIIDGEEIEEKPSDFKVVLIEAFSAYGDFLQYYMDRCVTASNIVSKYFKLDSTLFPKYFFEHLGYRPSKFDTEITTSIKDTIRQILIGSIDGDNGEITNKSEYFTETLYNCGITHLEISDSLRSLIEGFINFIAYMDCYIKGFAKEFNVMGSLGNIDATMYLLGFPVKRNIMQTATITLTRTTSDITYLEKGYELSIDGEKWFILEEVLFRGNTAFKEKVIKFKGTREIVTKKLYSFRTGDIIKVEGLDGESIVCSIDYLKSGRGFQVIIVDKDITFRPDTVTKAISIMKGEKKTIEFTSEERPFEYVNIGKAGYYPLSFSLNRFLEVDSPYVTFKPMIISSDEGVWSTLETKDGDTLVIFKGLPYGSKTTITFYTQNTVKNYLSMAHDSDKLTISLINPVFDNKKTYYSFINSNFLNLISGQIFEEESIANFLKYYLDIDSVKTEKLDGEGIFPDRNVTKVTMENNRAMAIGEQELLRELLSNIMGNPQVYKEIKCLI